MKRRKRRSRREARDRRLEDELIHALQRRLMCRLMLEPLDELTEDERIAGVGAAHLLGVECAEVDLADGTPFREFREVFEDVAREHLLWADCEVRRYWEKATNLEPRALAFTCAYTQAVRKRAGIPPLTL